MWGTSLGLYRSLGAVETGEKNKWGELGLGLGKAFRSPEERCGGYERLGWWVPLILQGGCLEMPLRFLKAGVSSGAQGARRLTLES